MRTFHICLILILNYFSVLSDGEMLKFWDETPEIIRDEATVKDHWEHMEDLLKNLANAGVRTILPLLIDSMESSNISSTCVKDSIRLIAGIRRLKPWAARFLDSTAKSLDGVLSLTAASYGVFDECIETVVPNERRGKHHGEVLFTGKYCLLHIKPHLPPIKKRYKEGEILKGLEGIYERNTVLSEAVKYAAAFYYTSIRLGICVPSGCSVEDINQILLKGANYTRLYIKVSRCEIKEDPKYTTVRIIIMTVYAFAGFMVLIGTLIDTYFYYSKTQLDSIPIRALLAFSLMSNFKKLVNTTSSEKTLNCMNGIRFLALSQIILGHSYLLAIFQHSNTMMNIVHLKKLVAFQVICNGYVSVETFFFLGGLLVCYNGVNHVVHQKKQFSIALYFLHRLWRILPSYIFVILFVFIAELVTAGPTSHKTFRTVLEDCENNWWANLLFINNFYRPVNKCLEHTWYLSVDMQLYVASLIIILPLFRRPKIGLSIAFTSLVVSMVISGAIAAIKDLQPTLLVQTSLNADDARNYIAEYYVKPYPHIGPYIIGILTGYFLAMNPKLKIPKVVQLVGWSCAIVLSASAIYGTQVWNAGKEATFWEVAFYCGCHKVAWALGVAWMVICCVTGHGGIVNYILSWKVWIILGRLTFMTYLVHYMVQICFLSSLRSTVDALNSVEVWLFFGHLMASFGVAFVASMLIESPVISLEKLFLRQDDKKLAIRSKNADSHPIHVTQTTKKGDVENSNGKFNILASLNGLENSGFEDKC